MKLFTLVDGWQGGWKWISNIAFASIIGVNTQWDTISAAFVNALPPSSQATATVVLAVVGIIGRHIKQSKSAE